MLVDGKNYEGIWLDEDDPAVVKVINQQKLPFSFEISDLRCVEDAWQAIREMVVRGAPLIGVTGAYGMYLATLEINAYTNVPDHLSNAARYLISSRPTAVNLSLSVNYVLKKLLNNIHSKNLSRIALTAARETAEKEKNLCREIGIHGLKLIEDLSKEKEGEPVNILTHCNAGWLACIDYGTALAPVYFAHDRGIPVHVWVDETRPVNQGARLTAWELGKKGVPYTLIPDNTGGYLMQKGMVDVVIVGSDRTSSTGDVVNKIGTYLKALAAHDTNIPFYAAVPSTSIDMQITDAYSEVIIEERPPEEVTMIKGIEDGEMHQVRICPENTIAANWGFDITPARLVTGLITEKGIIRANSEDIKNLFSD
ncbi:MAG: S-methyl-5-thioribose-1-phosphate isomerase [Bacteroidales bacterium]|nr:S-methyl-5-thioribose-1-phosphate isomerase [Bacteroidales bacterium]